jgi:hypothetical protein
VAPRSAGAACTGSTARLRAAIARGAHVSRNLSPCRWLRRRASVAGRPSSRHGRISGSAGRRVWGYTIARCVPAGCTRGAVAIVALSSSLVRTLISIVRRAASPGLRMRARGRLRSPAGSAGRCLSRVRTSVGARRAACPKGSLLCRWCPGRGVRSAAPAFVWSTEVERRSFALASARMLPRRNDNWG